MTKEELELQIRQVRKDISQYVNTIKSIKCPEAGRELALSITNYQLGAMWLGKLLGLLGSQNPYPESRNPESPVIEKHADTVEFSKLVVGGDNIANIKMLRADFKDLSDLTKEIEEEINNNSHDTDSVIVTIHSLKQLSEADMWLGMALGAIKEKADTIK